MRFPRRTWNPRLAVPGASRERESLRLARLSAHDLSLDDSGASDIEALHRHNLEKDPVEMPGGRNRMKARLDRYLDKKAHRP
jgi:hypothetical protein